MRKLILHRDLIILMEALLKQIFLNAMNYCTSLITANITKIPFRAFIAFNSDSRIENPNTSERVTAVKCDGTTSLIKINGDRLSFRWWGVCCVKGNNLLLGITNVIN